KVNRTLISTWFVSRPEETTEHILLQCPGYTEQRRRLFDVYGGLGLPHVSLDHL
ncbi:hypothetical protein MRX96_046313, partial [Rhipicephalus microplus]